MYAPLSVRSDHLEWDEKGEKVYLKGGGLKILMEAHSLFFPTFM